MYSSSSFIALALRLELSELSLISFTICHHVAGDSPELDLAVLAACNHSIMTLGTFGFWGSYLAGGEVLYPNISWSEPYPMGYEAFMATKLIAFTPIDDPMIKSTLS